MEPSVFDGEIIAIPYSENPNDGHWIAIIEGEQDYLTSYGMKKCFVVRKEEGGQHISFPIPYEEMLRHIVGR